MPTYTKTQDFESAENVCASKRNHETIEAAWDGPTTTSTSQMITHFYHVFADGEWEQPVTEHIAALETSGLNRNINDLYLGLVGLPDRRIDVVRFFHARGIYPVVAAEADEGWEHVTLEALRKRCATGDGIVFYAHSKGAYNATDINIAWRRSMTYYNIVQWRQNLVALQDHDTSGCHFIDDRAQHNGLGHRFYGGTYWWATYHHIRQLPDLVYHSRWCAEWWIGERFDDWKHFDTNPGWPDFPVFKTDWSTP